MNKLNYLLQWADNSLILGHRLGEWCGHGPVLEQDIALTNIALDLIGEARNIYQYAAEIEGSGKDEDYYPYMRKEREFRNTLLVEHSNVDFAYTIIRQFLFDTYHYFQLKVLSQQTLDPRIRSIAAKSFKEVSYHLEFSSDWVKRLGDGTHISHQKIQQALDDLWEYGQEFFISNDTDDWAKNSGLDVDLETMKSKVNNLRVAIIEEATLNIPDTQYFKDGGKEGLHTEQLGYILTDMQYLQRTYPGASW